MSFKAGGTDISSLSRNVSFGLQQLVSRVTVGSPTRGQRDLPENPFTLAEHGHAQMVITEPSRSLLGSPGISF